MNTQPSSALGRLYRQMQHETITIPTVVPDTSLSVLGFEAFYRDRFAPMVRLAALLVDRIDLAEEIVQESFAAVYQRWDRLDAPQSYLRTAVVNRSRDALRWRRRRTPAVVDEATMGPAGAESAEPVDHVRAAIAALPARQRAALVLRFYEDLTIDDIALALSARPGTVKSLLHRALATLREEIER